MKWMGSLTRGVLVLGLALPLASSVACGGSGNKEPEVVKAQVTAGNLPDGGDWVGVYYSQLYGYLHMTKSGKHVTGVWKAPGGTWGRLSGEVTGDLLLFEWEEHVIGGVGPSSTKRGRGYFKYHRPEGEIVSDELKGEWGLGESNAGNAWEAVKQKNQEPDPNSILEEVGAAAEDTTGGGWDEPNKAPEGVGGGEDDGSVGIDDEGEGGE